jgi:hypothetical protein
MEVQMKRKLRCSFTKVATRLGYAFAVVTIAWPAQAFAAVAAGGAVILLNGPVEIVDVEILVEIFFGNQTVTNSTPQKIGHLSPHQSFDYRMHQYPFPAGITTFIDADRRQLLMRGTILLRYVSALNGFKYEKHEYFAREPGGKARIMSREAPTLLSESQP